MVEVKQEINRIETSRNTKTRQPQRGSHLVTFSHAHVMALIHILNYLFYSLLSIVVIVKWVLVVFFIQSLVCTRRGVSRLTLTSNGAGTSASGPLGSREIFRLGTPVVVTLALVVGAA